ncbi:MAG TPA: asparagine--tRNA ligase, partial [Aigarchaeota archaeon]|nr:asparagine--tRNA ligase [Aigarchaeota archaeon]
MLKTVHVEEAFTLRTGDRVELLGWIRNVRHHGKLVFLDLRDSTGVIQVTVKTGVADEETVKTASTLGKEASVKVVGRVVEDRRAPGGREILCGRLEVVGRSYGEFPIKPGVGPRFLYDNRHLYLRSPKVSAVMKIRASMAEAARRWFIEHGFT